MYITEKIFQKTMEKPVVVNSMLCFIHNFRHHPHVDVLTKSYFSQCVNDVARRTLIDILQESTSKKITEDLSVFELYDQVMNLTPSPLFVAADLTTLPIVLISDQNQNKNIFNEIHQLRFFIQSALAGAQQTSKRIPSCSLSIAEDCGINNKIKEEVPSPTMNDRYSPLLGTISSSSHNENAEINSQTTSTVSSTTTTPKKNYVKRQAPYRLDQAVRKLTDRLEAKKEENESKLSSPRESVEIKQNDNEEEKIIEEKPTENSSPISLTQTLTPQQILANNLLYPTTTVDPIALTLMFKNLTNNNANNNVNQNNDFLNQHKLNQQNNDNEIGSDNDDGDDDDKMMSNESSPTPSDSSNGDKYKYIKDGDKPFTCGQTNCNKRFANKFLLKKHQFIHTGLRPHICPYCAKRFNRKDNLLRHKKTHVANANLPTDGRRRHHALLSPAPLESLHNFPLNLLQISKNKNLNGDAEDKKIF